MQTFLEEKKKLLHISKNSSAVYLNSIQKCVCFFQLQLKNSPYYVIAALLMLTSFFCARVLIFPYLYWRYAVHAGLDILRVPMSIPVKCNLGCLLILLPQLYWFWLMLRGVVKAFYKMYVRWKGKPHGR